MFCRRLFNNERGAVLVTGIMFIAVLSLIGSSAYLSTSNELKTSRNYRLSKVAFYDAEAGMEFALAKVEGYLEEDTITLPATVDSTVALVHTVPGNYNFTLSDITNKADNSWSLTSIGNDLNSGSSSEIEILFEKKTSSVFAGPIYVGGDADFKSGAGVYSFDPNDTNACTNDPDCAVDCYADPDDSCFVSTGDADVNANGTITINANAIIDGDINAGAGIDDDPLGIDDGGAYDPTTYSSSNDNAWAGIGTTIGGTTTLCGKPGGANYYFTDITLYNGDTLYIDTDNSTAACSGLGAGGPVNIFHDNTTDNIDFKTSSAVDIDSGSASDFGLYSNTTGNIFLKHDGDFTGFIYAPFANIDTKNSATYTGALFANSIDMKSDSTMYYDTSLQTAANVPTILTDDVVVTAWRNVLNY